jgi:tetratricopeptide (TPR) repeat protein
MGDQENMVAWMKKAVEGGSQDETYYYTLGEDAVNKGDADAAKAYADKALEVLEAKPVPEGVAEEQWAAQKEKMTAYINFLLGRIYMPKNTKDAYRTARSYMLKSVDVLKAEGGPRYHVLAYFLGVCYVQLDIQGDNIKQALFWMNEAARTDGQFKAQAAEAVKKINAAR